MSDTVKLIIEIPKDMYKRCKEYRLRCGEAEYLEGAVAKSIPLDDVKAIMEKQIEGDFAFSETETFKVPCHYGTANGLQVAVRILENIGKTESEEE